MTITSIVIVVIAALALLAIATGQRRAQGQQDLAGRYRLLSAQYNWLATDAELELVVDDRNHLFRIDTITGQVQVLAFHADQSLHMHSFWAPVGQ